MKKQNLSNLDHLEYDYRNPVSEFSERATVVRQPRFSLKSTDNLSLFHDVQNTSGSGTITDNPDEFVLSTSGSGDEATLESAEFGRYTPGFSAQLGIGMRKVSLASGGIIELGLPIPRQEILLLGVETIGSQSATASSVLSWFEAH